MSRYFSFTQQKDILYPTFNSPKKEAVMSDSRCKSNGIGTEAALARAADVCLANTTNLPLSC